MADPPLPAIQAQDEPPGHRPSVHPEPFASRMAGRHQRPLGGLFGLSSFGMNCEVLQPGAVSLLRHAHTLKDQFVTSVSGPPTLHTDAGATLLAPGMGERTPGDRVTSPHGDLVAAKESGRRRFFHRDGSPYPEGERG